VGRSGQTKPRHEAKRESRPSLHQPVLVAHPSKGILTSRRGHSARQLGIHRGGPTPRDDPHPTSTGWIARPAGLPARLASDSSSKPMASSCHSTTSGRQSPGSLFEPKPLPPPIASPRSPPGRTRGVDGGKRSPSCQHSSGPLPGLRPTTRIIDRRGFGTSGNSLVQVPIESHLTGRRPRTKSQDLRRIRHNRDNRPRE
jgi:hypothetical protein